MYPREINAVKKNWRNVALRFGLCYPSLYRVGMSCLAIRLLYELLNSWRDVACERFFFEGEGPLLSVESSQPPSKFDVLGFSLQYELDYVNFIRMLISSGIPALACERTSDHPIIVAGGPAVTANPEPVAPIVDAVVIGEVEPIIDGLVDALKLGDRERVLEGLSSIDGVYVPKFEEPVRRVWASSLDDAPHAIAQVIPLVSADSSFSPIFGGSFMLEVTRGCRWGCRFCLEGYNYLPMRERSIKAVERILSEGLACTPTDKVVLIGSAAFDHSRFEDLCEHIVSLGLKISVPSMRASALSERLAKILVKGGQRTIAFAPEAGSDCLREVVNKRLSTSEIIDAAKIALDGGFRHVKLYFMIGLPGESLDDVKSIVELAKRIADLGFSAPKSVRLTVSPFIPKAHTPFQWLGLEDTASLRYKFGLLRRMAAKDHRIELRVMRVREAVIQAFLSTSGREAAALMIRVAELGGSLAAWRRAERELGISIEDAVLAGRGVDEPLPWDHVDVGVSRAFLVKEHFKAMEIVRENESTRA